MKNNVEIKNEKSESSDEEEFDVRKVFWLFGLSIIICMEG